MIEHQERATENLWNFASKSWWELIFNQWDTLTDAVSPTHTRNNANAYVTHSCTHRPTTSFLWEVVQVQILTLTRGFKGQKVCFPRFTPYYLFMKQRGRDGEIQRGKETERNPPVRGLWCGKQNLLFNLPSNGIHMTHPELVHTVCQFFSSLCLPACLLVCVCMCCGFRDVHTCAR